MKSEAVGFLLVPLAVWLAGHELPITSHHELLAEIMPGMYDGPTLEREGGRRWLIMRTGGRWQ
jgi:hypothetical protein